VDWFSLLKGAIVGGILLFLWSGLTQSLTPWGIKSVKELEDQSTVGEILERQSVKGLYYFTDKVTAFIAVKPESYYSMTRFFTLEFFTELLVATTLTAILLLTATQSITIRLLLIGLATLTGIFSTDLQYWNWWGFSTIYSIGISVNRLIGHLLVGFILIKFILI
jgi:hypothetical protein